MKTLINLLILAAQCSITFLVLICAYMLFVLLDYQGGIGGFLGVTVVQPILGSLITFITIGLCLIVGLPIRFVSRINSWWSQNYLIPIAGGLIGLVLLSISLLPSMSETITTIIEDQQTTKEIPSFALVISGWFVTAFSVLHIFPTQEVKLRLEKSITKLIT